MRQITFALVAALGITAPAAFAAAATVHYRVTVLPALDGNVAANSRGKSINDLGLVAGYSNASNGRRHAAAWAFGRKLDLGTLGAAPDLASSVPWPSRFLLGLVSGISLVDDLDPNGGQGWSCTAGGFLANPGGHTCHGFVWAWGRMRDLPPLPGGNNSFATGTNNWGQTGGWAENGVADSNCVAPQAQQFKPVIWGPGSGQVRVLPLVDGDTSGSVTALNDRGQAVSAMERLAGEVLPDGFAFEWSELAYQEKLAGDTAIYVFIASVVFVFLFLAAQYESWLLPMAVILIVPMCLLAAISGVLFRGMDNNILTQIGFVVLIGLAAKNAILIVEFAKQAHEAGMSRYDAAVSAARTRLRPILMTSLAFILGVVPLVFSTGAGAEMRQSLGTAVFAGMLGVTAFGLLFTPVFYVISTGLAELRFKWRKKDIETPTFTPET